MKSLNCKCSHCSLHVECLQVQSARVFISLSVCVCVCVCTLCSGMSTEKNKELFLRQVQEILNGIKLDRERVSV